MSIFIFQKSFSHNIIRLDHLGRDMIFFDESKISSYIGDDNEDELFLDLRNAHAEVMDFGCILFASTGVDAKAPDGTDMQSMGLVHSPVSSRPNLRNAGFFSQRFFAGSRVTCQTAYAASVRGR